MSDGNRLSLLNTATGEELRTIHESGPETPWLTRELTFGRGEDDIYASIRTFGDCGRILRIDPNQGSVEELVVNGQDGAVGPDGSLAYLAMDQLGEGEDAECRPSAIVVRNLSTGEEQRWPVTADAPQDFNGVSVLAWSPAGDELAFIAHMGDRGAADRGIRILDTSSRDSRSVFGARRILPDREDSEVFADVSWVEEGIVTLACCAPSPDTQDDQRVSRLVVVDPDTGREQQELVRFERSIFGLLFDLDTSADHVLWVEKADSSKRLWGAKLDGSERTKIAEDVDIAYWE